MQPRSATWCAVLACALAANGCTDHTGHDHGSDAVGDGHHVRDPATEPCDGTNWMALFPDLRQCALAGAILAGTSLRRADLSDANLTGADVAGADLFTAVLDRATAIDARFDGAKLTSTHWIGADLSGASLVGTTLINADLTGAVLAGTTTDATTTCPDGTAGPCW